MLLYAQAINKSSQNVIHTQTQHTTGLAPSDEHTTTTTTSHICSSIVNDYSNRCHRCCCHPSTHSFFFVETSSTILECKIDAFDPKTNEFYQLNTNMHNCRVVRCPLPVAIQEIMLCIHLKCALSHHLVFGHVHTCFHEFHDRRMRRCYNNRRTNALSMSLFVHVCLCVCELCTLQVICIQLIVYSFNYDFSMARNELDCCSIWYTAFLLLLYVRFDCSVNFISFFFFVFSSVLLKQCTFYIAFFLSKLTSHIIFFFLRNLFIRRFRSS